VYLEDGEMAIIKDKKLVIKTIQIKSKILIFKNSK